METITVMVTTMKTVRPFMEGQINLTQVRKWFSDEGEEQTEAQTQSIDWSKVNLEDVPVDLIKKHPQYKQVLDESIQRRHEIKELKQKLPEQAPEQPEVKDNSADEMPAWAKQLMDSVSTITQERNQNVRVKAAQEAGLPEKLASKLSGTTYEEYLADANDVAATLGIKKQKEGGEPLNPSAADTTDNLRQAVRRVRKGEDRVDMFSASEQKTLGGGALTLRK